jgi:hypothetical protein
MRDEMIERVFLGWDGPLLPRVVERLQGGDARSGIRNLENAVIVVPGGRAGRRLQELLSRADATLCPPRIVTTGELPELLYEPTLPPAATLMALLAWTAALKSVPKKTLASLLPLPPDDDDVSGWLDVAEELAAATDALAADSVVPGEVAARCGAKIPEFLEEERWNAISRVHREYLSCLKHVGLSDANTERLAAVTAGRVHAPGEIFLLGVAELNGITRALLDASAASTTIRAFVPAPESEKDGFDGFGCPVPEAWMSRRIAIDPESIRIVDQPRDETVEVLRAIGNDPLRSVDEITIGLGDEAAADALVRGLHLAGVPARPPAICKLAETAPWILLAGLARLAESRAFRDMASLIRHPDIERYLRTVLKSNLPDDWLARVDKAAADSALLDAAGPFPGLDSGVVRVVAEAVIKLLPPDESIPLARWPETITALLRKVYGARTLDRWNESDRAWIESLERIAGGLLRLELIPGGGAFGSRVSFATAVEMLRRILESETIPSEGGEPAIEMLGWLELALDDAPRLIVTDFNERMIPRSVTADPFLPDSLRRALGLADNARRYARDAYLLTAILASRPEVTLIGARRDAAGNPRVPSRLLLACDDETLPRRLALFYEGGGASAAPASILRAGAESMLAIPAPEPHAAPTELRVTAFRDFIACPYRFYLRHLLGLRPADEPAEEWTRASFGNAAHEALRIFGESEAEAAKPCMDAREIADRLEEALDRSVEERYGRRLPPAILVQKEILRARLRKFAEVQAEMAREGWKIEEVEKELTTDLEGPAGPFRITGHLDRIDRRENGEVRILDYKTGDSGEPPEKKHRKGGKGAKRWIDLQLPLYRRLLLDRTDRSYPAAISLGFVILGKDPSKIEFSAAPWDEEELAGAEALAVEIVREILEGRFWKPEDVPRFEDGLGFICMDDFIDRAAVIERVTRLHAPKASRLERCR